MTIFDIFKTCFTKEEILSYDIFDIYMINYLFSFHEKYVSMSNMLNKYHYKDKKQCYQFYYYGVDKGKAPFANIKKEKKIEIDEDKLKLAMSYLPEMSIEKIKENWLFIEKELKG